MSGRRSSSVEGRPGGTVGKVRGHVGRRDAEVGRRVPGEHRDGVLELRALRALVDRLGLGALELRLGLHHVRLGRHAGAVAVLRHVVRGLECLDGVLEQRDLRIGRAQLEIVGGELGLHRQAHVLDVGGGRELLGVRRLHQAAHAAPEVDLPARGGGHGVAPAGRAAAVADRHRVAGRAAAVARGTRAHAQGREERGARELGRRQRLGVARLGGLERLVRDAHLLDEAVQHRIVERFPPLALGSGVGGLRDDPLAGFLVRRGRFDFGLLVVGPDRASRDQGNGNHR